MYGQAEGRKQKAVGRKQWLALSLVLMASRAWPVAEASGQGSSAVGQEPNLELTVRVFSYAQVSSQTLGEAEQKATWIFRRAGVETVWLDCGPSAPDVQTNPACKQLLGPTDIVLRILPGSKAARAAYGYRCGTLGFALQSTNGGVGSYASIFYDRVEDLAKAGIASPALVLGHGMAHEIGHLLLGSTAHSLTGIMAAEWGRSDLTRAAMGDLLFHHQQSDLMRAELQARVRDQRAP